MNHFLFVCVLTFCLCLKGTVTAEESCPDEKCFFGKECILKAVGIGTTVMASTALVIGWGLGFLGFGPLGPVLGSAAALWQSKIGIVAGGSLFAALQSAGMIGLNKVVLLGYGSAVSSVIFASCSCQCNEP